MASLFTHIIKQNMTAIRGISGKSWKESSSLVEQTFNDLKTGLGEANTKLDELIQFKTVLETLDKERQRAVSTATKVVVPIVAAVVTIVVTIVAKLVFGV